MIFLYIFICLIFAAFFAGIETGLLAADQFYLYSMKKDKKLYAIIADYMLLKPERLLGTTLIGTNLAVVTAAVLLSSYLRMSFPYWINWTGTFVLTVIFLIFSEVIPKSFFKKYSDSISVRLSPVVFVFYVIFLPVSFLLNGAVKVLLLFAGQLKENEKTFSTKEDLRLLVKLSSRELNIPYSEQRIVDEIFDLKDMMAREVMIPLHELPIISFDSSIEDVYESYMKNRIRFIGVYQDRSDNIIGYIDIEDIIYTAKKDIESLVQRAVFYPDTKKIPSLFEEMIENDSRVVFLSDEYGGISGMITTTEIVAEIIGYMPGSNIHQEEEIQILGKNHYVVTGTADLEEFSHQTGIKLEKGVYDTVGGYICDKLGRIPNIGETCEFEGVFFRILDGDERHIKRLEVLKKRKKNEA